MQESLILNPAQGEDQTHKPIEWLTLKINTLNMFHWQVHSVVPWVLSQEERKNYMSMLKVQSPRKVQSFIKSPFNWREKKKQVS
jgi:hypothetical protein